MTNAEIDTLWNRALQASVMAGEEFTRYRFAAMIEAVTVRRCAEIACEISERERKVYKGRSVPVDKERAYNPHTDGMSDGAAVVEEAIREEFSEAFPTDPNKWAFDRGLEST